MLGAAASLLLVYALIAASPTTHFLNAQSMMASAGVGIFVGVEPNPYNTLAQQLEEKEAELSEREREVLALERGVFADSSFVSSNTMATYSLGLSFLLFILLGSNFYMDWKRGRKELSSGKSNYAINLNKKI